MVYGPWIHKESNMTLQAPTLAHKTHIQNVIIAFFFFSRNTSKHQQLMSIFCFKVMIMRVFILVMLSLPKTLLKSCFKFGFRALDLFFQKSPMVENARQQ